MNEQLALPVEESTLRTKPRTPSGEIRAPQANTLKPLDMQQLIHRCLGRIELAERLLKSFVSRFPQDLEKIEECLHSEDSANLARLVHQSKGAAANISAPDLYATLCRMEQAVRGEDWYQAWNYLNDVQQAWDRFVEFQSSLNQQPSCPAATSDDTRRPTTV